jgi:hypothetical protein
LVAFNKNILISDLVLGLVSLKPLHGNILSVLSSGIARQLNILSAALSNMNGVHLLRRHRMRSTRCVRLFNHHVLWLVIVFIVFNVFYALFLNLSFSLLYFKVLKIFYFAYEGLKLGNGVAKVYGKWPSMIYGCYAGPCVLLGINQLESIITTSWGV